ncbi:MAG: hypothetical protein CL424_17935 [Acidimicrobiaceae bacterium]|nr:hypothetical protein [Acidimicrobiaceae bacterium]
MSRSIPILVASLLALAGIGALAAWSNGDDRAGDAASVTVPAVPVVSTLPEVPIESSTTSTIPADCAMSVRLDLGVVDEQVACLESRLVAAGVFTGEPDHVFDESTDAAVRAFQSANDLFVDGIAGPTTAGVLGNWTGGRVTPADPDTCPDTGRAAVIDRAHQRTWLCDGGEVTREMPMTSAITQPDPGTYEVYAKDLRSWSNIGDEVSTMTHFVAFTHGKYQGARIAFHSIPTWANGDYVQPLDSVGDPSMHGDSSGCIRVLPDDAVAIWDHLAIGDTVTVVS